MKHRIFCYFFCLLAMPFLVFAAAPVIYSHGDITIMPAVEAPLQAETKAKPSEEKDAKNAPGKAEAAVATTPRATHIFNVEIRPEQAFIQNAGMFTQPVLDGKHGIMAVLDQPGLVPVIGDNIYTAFDILFVNAYGKIVQIAPEVNLSELYGEITPKEPVRAFIYLQAGICKKLDIRPGDIVAHETFRKSPTIIN